MTPKRQKQLECTDAELTDEEKAEGWHFCPDWDFMVIHADSPEGEACHCKSYFVFPPEK